MTTSLTEIEVLVVDCQSTGARPQHGALLELGWCRARASHDEPPPVTAHLLALPDGTRIPRAVTRITGITQRHLVDAVPVEHAYRELLASAATVPPLAEGHTPAVIHYASYERAWLAHLDSELGDADTVSLDVMCTHEIAKRLLSLPRQGLRPLAGYYGFAPDLVRRCEGHVAATAHVWRHLVRELAALGVGTWTELADWLRDTPPVSRKQRVQPMDRKKRLALPDRPGIYRMLRTNGDVLYVGKATSLKKRVNSYFTKRRGHNERTMEMLSQARDLAVTVTETTLEAALLETDLIKAESPPYNVQLLGETRDAWFSTTDLSGAATLPDDTFRVGPLPSRFALSSYASLRALLAFGATPTPDSMARAMAMPRAFAPDEPVFREGVALFASRYALDRVTHPALMRLSKRLLALSRGGLLDEGETVEGERSWDAPRVARHLERVVMQAGQLIRRSRWLLLLSEASVSWQMATPVRRLLVVEKGRVTARALLPVEAAPPPPPGAHRGRQSRQASFDIAVYDRLRVLSTELKRISAENRQVDVRLSERVILSGASLTRLLEAI